MEEKNVPHSGCLLCETVMPMLEKFWPHQAMNHFRASRVEFLKGIRSLIDERIAHLSREENKGVHVSVE
jgi:hypothetical protein